MPKKKHFFLAVVNCELFEATFVVQPFSQVDASTQSDLMELVRNAHMMLETLVEDGIAAGVTFTDDPVWATFLHILHCSYGQRS